jgi:hypothetical protein
MRQEMIFRNGKFVLNLPFFDYIKFFTSLRMTIFCPPLLKGWIPRSGGEALCIKSSRLHRIHITPSKSPPNRGDL